MKKTVMAAVLSVIIVFSLCACSSDKIAAHITLNDMDGIVLTEIPANSVNFSTSGNTISITIEKDGDYSFAVEDEDGHEHSFTLRYQNGEASLIHDDEISVSLTVD